MQTKSNSPISITIKSKDDAILKEKWQLVWEKLKYWRTMEGDQGNQV